MKWIFERPGRLWGTVAAAACVAILVTGLVLTIKANRALDAIPTNAAGASPTALSDASIPVTTGNEEYGRVPDPEPTRASLGASPAGTDVQTDVGDPEPRVLAAVDAWAHWQFETLGKYMLPAAEEDAIGNPPGKSAGDLKVTGIVTVVESGPSQAVVQVPTNKGTLLVDVVVQEGEWWIAAMGWK
jgi:hypothetical protein